MWVYYQIKAKKHIFGVERTYGYENDNNALFGFLGGFLGGEGDQNSRWQRPSYAENFSFLSVLLIFL